MKKGKRTKPGARGVRMKDITPEDDQLLVDLKRINHSPGNELRRFPWPILRHIAGSLLCKIE
jgi:hypothetical protein